MLTVITFFWRLCTLRAHPSQVPTAPWFVGLVVVANFGTSYLLSAALTDTVGPGALATAIVVQQACMACLVWLALYFRNVDSRFTATITAIFGCDLLLTALLGTSLPLLRSLAEGASNSALLLSFLWAMAINGHILHEALQIRYLPATAIAFGIWFLCTVVSQAVLEPPL